MGAVLGQLRAKLRLKERPTCASALPKTRFDTPVISEIQHAARDEEQEVLVGRTGRHLAGAQQLGETGDRDQRGILQAQLPDVADAGQREAQHLRDQDAARGGQARHADRARGLELAARDGQHRGAIDLGLVGAGDHADRQRADRERRHADEAVGAEPLADGGDQRRAAEIEQVDHEQFGHAAKHRRVAVAEHAQQCESARAWRPPPGAPNTAPISKADKVSTIVISAPSSSTLPQPSDPKPSVEMREDMATTPGKAGYAAGARSDIGVASRAPPAARRAMPRERARLTASRRS